MSPATEHQLLLYSISIVWPISKRSIYVYSIIPTLPQQLPHLQNRRDGGAYLFIARRCVSGKNDNDVHPASCFRWGQREEEERTPLGLQWESKERFLSAQPISTLHQFVGSPCETKGRRSTGQVTLINYLSNPMHPLTSMATVHIYYWPNDRYTHDWPFTSSISYLLCMN